MKGNPITTGGNVIVVNVEEILGKPTSEFHAECLSLNAFNVF
jgi:hypothetical protein